MSDNISEPVEEYDPSSAEFYEVDVDIDFSEDGTKFDIKFSGIEVDYADSFFNQLAAGVLAEAIYAQR